MDTRLNAPWIALRFALGLTATLAGLDKFFNLLANWEVDVIPFRELWMRNGMQTFHPLRQLAVFAPR